MFVNYCRVIVVAFRNLNMTCNVCDEAADAHMLKCSGPCENIFHITCLHSKNPSYKNALLTHYMNKIPNLRWLCDACVSIPPVTHNAFRAELNKQLEDVKTFAENYLTKLDTNIMTKQIDIGSLQSSQQNGQISDDLNVSNTTEPAVENGMDISPSKSHEDLNRSGTSSIHSNVNSKTRKRPLALESSPGLSPKSKQQKCTEKQAMSLAEMIAKPKPKPSTAEANITVKTNMIRSIYVTPFDPSIVPDDVINHLNSIDDLKQIVPNIKCTKLGSKRRNVPLSFVSFKLDVPRHHFDIIVNPANWQTNGKDELIVKEFIDKRVNSPSTKFNPFSKSNVTQNWKNGNDHPFENGKGKSKGAERPPKNAGKPNSARQQPQNFLNCCQKQCCSRPNPKPNCNRCHDHCDENRYGRRPPNRR